MSLSTLTRYLRLKIKTDLALPASQNLARLDALGNTFAVDENDKLEVRSRGNLVLKPEASEVGGDGSGGEVHIGTSSQPVAVKFFASSFAVAGGAGSLLTEDSLNTVTNKSLSGNSNLFSNIGYASLNLSASIKNSDIASDANIADSKLATISTAGKVNFSSLTGNPSGTVFPSYSGNGQKYLRLNSDGSALEWSSVPAGYSDTDADARVAAGIAALKGMANGLASLGSDGKVPSAQLPSAPVTSVNGQTGAVSISIPTQYTDGMADSRADARIATVKGQPSGLASLDAGGKLPSSQLPSLAITDTNVVSSQSAMLALSAEQGDIAIRTDNGKTYILAGNPAVLGDWKEITAGGAVTSVNGQSGTVSLTTSDIAQGSNKYYTQAQAKIDLVAYNIDDAAQYDKSPSLAVLKAYSYPKANMGAAGWVFSNSFTITHNYGTKNIAWMIVDSVSGEQVFVDSPVWGANNNSITFTLPNEATSGSWLVFWWKL